MRMFLVVHLALLLAACGSSGGGSPIVIVPPVLENVHVKCADVYHVGEGTECDAPPIARSDWGLVNAAHAAIEVDAGVISRSAGDLVESRVDVQNLLETNTTIYVEMRFDANCAGQPGEWVIMPKQEFTLDPENVTTFRVSGMCGDMPLGPRTMTTTVWAEDRQTVIDFAVVKFTLVE